MKHKFCLFLFSCGLILGFGSAARLLACGYQYASPVCEFYGKSNAVFVGKVLQISEIKNESYGSGYKIDLLVRESFLDAPKGARVSLILSGAQPEYYCLEPNKSFLIYTRKGNRGYFIDAGSRTRPVEDAEEDLAFLRSLPKTKPGARLYGTIMRMVKSSIEEDNKVPVAGMRLKIESLDAKPAVFYANTDENGRYELKSFPGGRYRIYPLKPLAGLKLQPEIGSGEIEVNDKGCVSYNFTVETVNKFVGKIIDAEGKPVPNIDVEILAVGAKKPDGYVGTEFANTGSDGAFYSYDITPGLYTVSINYSSPPGAESPFPTVFYPGVAERSEAAVIEIKAGDEITDFEFRLPPRLAERRFKGRAFWADNTPAAGVSVFLKDEAFNVCCIDTGVKTDAEGNFTLVGYTGRRYQIWAANSPTPRGVREIYGVLPLFSADDELKPFKIVINLTREQFEQAL